MTKVEVRGLRTQYEKVFQFHGGRFRSVVSGEPVHVQNAGKWEDINLDRVKIGDEVRYTNLPMFLCAVRKNVITVTGRERDFWLQVEAHPEDTTYEVNLKGFKSFLEIPSRDQAPRFVEFTLKTRNLTSRINPQGSEIAFYYGKVRVWSMKLPVMYDSAGEQIALDMDTMPGKDATLVHVSLPDEWLNDQTRAYPVVFDPTHTSDEAAVSNGGTTTYAVPETRTYTAGTAQCKWKGTSSYSGTVSTETNSNSGSTMRSSVSCVFPSIPSGASFYRCYSYHTASAQIPLSPESDPYNFSGSNNWWSATIYYGWGSGSWSASSSASYSNTKIGTTATTSANSGYPYQIGYAVYAYTQYYALLNTQNPKVTVGGQDTQYSGTLANDTWSSFQTMSGFSGTGTNSFSHTISGSGQAGWIFCYDWTYSRPTAIGYCKVVDGSGTVIECPIADPDDAALEYDCVRIGMPDGSVGCADLVDTDDAEAGPIRISTSGGIKAWRLVPT